MTRIRSGKSTSWSLGVALVATVASSMGCVDQHVDAAKPPTIRLGVGTRGGDFDIMGRALADTLSHSRPAYTIEIVTNEGAVSSLESLQGGTSDCGFSYSNVAYEAYAGRLSDEPGPLKRLRGVALVQVTPLYLLVRRASSIESIRDLPGHTLGFGVRGSASFRAASLVLNAHGIDLQSIHIKEEGFPASFRRLRDGQLDAVMILAGQSAAFVTRAVNTGARLLALQGPGIDALRERYPFLHPALVPANTYSGQATALRTVGIDSVLLCRDDVAADEVRQVTREWESTSVRLVREGTLVDRVSVGVASATPIPLHEGASDYYRSRQVLQR